MDLQRSQNENNRDTETILHNGSSTVVTSNNTEHKNAIATSTNGEPDNPECVSSDQGANNNDLMAIIQDPNESDVSDRQSPAVDAAGSLRRRSTTRNRRGKRLRAMHPTEDSSSSSSDSSLDVIALHFGARLQPSLTRPQFNAEPSTSNERTSHNNTRQPQQDASTVDDIVYRQVVAPQPETDASEESEVEADSDRPRGEVLYFDYLRYPDDSEGSLYHDHELVSDERMLERMHYLNYFEDHEYREENIVDQYDSNVILKYNPTPSTKYPRPEWQTCRALRDRRLGLNRMNKGIGSRSHDPFWFQRYACDSLFFIQRLIMSDKLKEHTGCVNSVKFNNNGNLLCSGSDDKTVCIWEWQKKKLRKKLISGHFGRIFQCCWFDDDNSIVTASADGSVRLLDIHTEQTNLLHAQRDDVNCFAYTSPKTIVTSGLDATVYEIDTRTRTVEKLFVVKASDGSDDGLCSLHTINSHPIDTTKLLVGGTSPYIYLYDTRMLKKNAQDEVDPLTTFCPQDLISTHNMVTSVAYNSIGGKILASYNDEDLYVFDSKTFNCEHKYRGHRNHKTIKGCLWFGDNFVLSGSDDGYIYGWDVESEHIVCSLHGDKSGSVNSLAMHPIIPVLAASGLDDDVKIWTPTSPEWPQTLKGIITRICKNVFRRTVLKGHVPSRLRNEDSDASDLGDDEEDDEDEEEDDSEDVGAPVDCVDEDSISGDDSSECSSSDDDESESED